MYKYGEYHATFDAEVAEQPLKIFIKTLLTLVKMYYTHVMLQKSQLNILGRLIAVLNIINANFMDFSMKQRF